MQLSFKYFVYFFVSGFPYFLHRKLMCQSNFSIKGKKKVNISDLSEKVIKVIFFPSWAILAEEIQLFFFLTH